VLAYGLFPDAVSARAEIFLLSKEVQRQKPWPKAISSIHEALKNTEKPVNRK
jgi:septal ring-binding cell division protein DamX